MKIMKRNVGDVDYASSYHQIHLFSDVDGVEPSPI